MSHQCKALVVEQHVALLYFGNAPHSVKSSCEEQCRNAMSNQNVTFRALGI